ncbi:hypothetical protein PHYSODRAFT_286790 [Phytophthora sojae]|uniref:Uncharacterized protein n=2 Tax=Phytophthora sojae TaxID=67593 RepID=G4ZVN9_PHYSP|nr:hypothetical protein PHYSODRAFT_286790 [Phytophthora sojae]AEK81157.1 Avh317 [Phytophthora sojae]AEK81158.1 Avh317 [Phytophthora sojae]EGZ11504.1 hypothetical protein PHYSODRAFT_286790 [Phytophthora sojae]|eukprot:XP_009531837.1 hypothetical protein PHYSODRAFT_286790 [Phytophthora sojae]
MITPATTHRSLRDGEYATNLDAATTADDEDEERGLALVTKLKTLANKFPTLDKYITLMRKNPDPKKLEAMVKSDPQLSKLKRTVKRSGLKITTRNIQRVRSISLADATGVNRLKMLFLLVVLCGLLGAGEYALFLLIEGLASGGITAPVGREIPT